MEIDATSAGKKLRMFLPSSDLHTVLSWMVIISTHSSAAANHC
jgi:hypothetical protein